MNAATTGDVLDRAADLLEEFGWCQSRWGGLDEGEVCPQEAIDQAARDLKYEFAGREPRLLTRVPFGGKISQVHWPHWNDDPARTKAQVVAKLREAASIARQQEMVLASSGSDRAL